MSADSSRSTSETEPVRAAAARHIVRQAMTASMATLEVSTGAPHASLVSVATLPSGVPVMAMSSLSHHHGNIASDDRVSLLFQGPYEIGNPLERGRVSVSGRAVKATDGTAGARFMARHPEAFYTGFGDFSYYTIEVARVHFVAGFGRVRWFRAKSFLVGSDLADAESDILTHMNEDHIDAVSAYATALLNAAPGDWRMCGIDVEGADLLCDGVALRIDFPQSATDAGAARRQLVELARKSRSGTG